MAPRGKQLVKIWDLCPIYYPAPKGFHLRHEMPDKTQAPSPSGSTHPEGNRHTPREMLVKMCLSQMIQETVLSCPCFLKDGGYF